ncbi:homeobox protein CDX-1-like isoform X2 [Cimex lectularius]|uniref:Homeobox domain-containing protein n=1 Tax=Cimex lectularius TaxID=79782 RepID=A0A8I6S734_CIMLE|nr:homeobox protein CDX-1-like isoform X2 [Cimex lectularius]
MYYQQYNMYKQSWYGGYQPAGQHQYLSCMHEEQSGWPQHVFQQQQPITEIWDDQSVVLPVTPQQQSPPEPQIQQRVPPARSPYEWMKKPSYQSQPNPGKTRTKDKYRVVYTDHQRLELEKEFHYSRYITIRRKAELATSLGLSERQVKIWFQNRRAKERKQVKKREELIHKEKMQQLAML